MSDERAIWTCAAGPRHTPEEPEGSADRLSTCTGCGNDVWVGERPGGRSYLEVEEVHHLTSSGEMTPEMKRIIKKGRRINRPRGI